MKIRCSCQNLTLCNGFSDGIPGRSAGFDPPLHSPALREGVGVVVDQNSFMIKSFSNCVFSSFRQSVCPTVRRHSHLSVCSSVRTSVRPSAYPSVRLPLPTPFAPCTLSPFRSICPPVRFRINSVICYVCVCVCVWGTSRVCSALLKSGSSDCL